MKQHFFSILFLVVAGYLVFILIEDGKKPTHVNGNVYHQKELTSDAVNRHLYETSLKMELQKDRQQIERVLPIHKDDQQVGQEGLYQEASDQDRMDDLVKKLTDHKGTDTSEIEGQIQNQLYQDEKLKEFDQEYRKNYIDQFIKNAHDGGYDIQVDYETLRIKSVRRIR